MAQPTTAIRGKEPSLFDGTRQKSDAFLREFEMYHAMNDTHDLFTNPYKRVILALSLIRGPNVNDWVTQQLKELKEKVNRTIHPIAQADEVLWDEFKDAFKNSFTDTTSEQWAYQQLMNLRMKGDDLDTYIAKFANLAVKAKYDINHKATVDLFYKRLKPELLRACLNRATPPDTMQEWLAAVKDEQRKDYRIQGIMNSIKHGGKWPSPQQWTARPQPKQYIHPNDRVIPMDTSAAVRKATTVDEKKKHRQEGRCFECSRQGHMARNCPKKKDSKQSI